MIRIIGDTTSGLTLDQAKQMGIEFIPQIIVFGDTSYRDDTEIDSETFVKKLMESEELPKTAAPPPALYTPIYQDMREKGDSAIIICPSAQLSGTVRSATTALADFPDLDVRIIDSLTIGSGQAMLLKRAKKAADDGKTLDEIEAYIRESIASIKFLAVVDTLEFLRRGGRIGGASKLLGDLLQIKPILTIVDGRVETFEKQRTKKRAINRVLEVITEECKDYSKADFSFSMLDTGAEKEMLETEFKQRFNAENIPFLNVPPCIMVHSGPGVIICSFFTN